MAIFEFRGNLCATRQSLDYLNLDEPVKFDIFPELYKNRDTFCIYFVKEVFNGERRKIKNTVNWLDVEESSFGLLFKDMMAKHINESSKWIDLHESAVNNPSLRLVFSKRGWCHHMILQFFIDFTAGKNETLFLLFFLRIAEVLEYFQHIPFNHTFSLLQDFYCFVPEEKEISLKFAVEIKKSFLVKDRFQYGIYRFSSICFRLPFNKKELVGTCMPYGDYSDDEKEKYYMIIRPKIIYLLINYGLINTFSQLELTGLPMCTFLTSDDDRDILTEPDPHLDDEVNLMKSIKEKRIPANLKHRLFQVLYLYRMRPKNKGYLRLVWDTIPDRYLVLDDFLPPAIKAKNEICNHTIEIYNWYKNLVGVECSVKMPRTLLYLSKCAIRSRLADNFVLPEGIHSLTVKAYGTPKEKIIPLPRPLQRYLLLYDIQFEDPFSVK